MKGCNSCGAQRAKGQTMCRPCINARRKESRPKWSEMPRERRRKATARAYTRTLVRRGVLARMPCEQCGAERAEIHHDDYSKPREVRWLCREHHMALHAQEGQQ